MTRLVGRGGCEYSGYNRDARDGMVVFRCIRYRLVKLQVEYHQSRDGASHDHVSERYLSA